MSSIFSRNKLMIPIVLFQSLWMFLWWLVFTSNLISQTTWLKVKLKLVNLVVLLWTSGRGTSSWIIGHLILIYIQKSATANAPLTISGVPTLPGGPWSHICHVPFLDTCFLIFLVTLFAAWLASDFVPTLYDFKLWPGPTVPPLLVTRATLMMYKMSNTSCFTAPIHTWSPSEGLMLPYFLLQA